MTRLPDLGKLRPSEKDDLIRSLWALLQEQQGTIEDQAKRIGELEAKLKAPPKDPTNSSLPPSRGQKSNKPKGDKKGRRRRPGLKCSGGGRRLHPNPDRLHVAKAGQCGHCNAKMPDDVHRLVSRHDRIELPPIKPVVTRVEWYDAHCPCCGKVSRPDLPDELKPGSPFGKSVEAMAVYLRYAHSISYQRMTAVFRDLFGLAISEGALANLYRRAQAQFAGSVANILAQIRSSPVICSDETGARINGRTVWEWVFHDDQACLHVIRDSRARAVVVEVLDGHEPEIWVSDLYGAQRGHGRLWQVCLAHQLRDVQYAIDAGDNVFAPAMMDFLVRACKIGARRPQLSDSTLRQYARDLDTQLNRCLALRPTQRDGRRLWRRYIAIRDHLLVFMAHREVPYTNNESERAVRPSTIFRKVTNGFRSDWGAELYAAIRSILNTAQRRDIDPFKAINDTLNGMPILKPG